MKILIQILINQIRINIDRKSFYEFKLAQHLRTLQLGRTRFTTAKISLFQKFRSLVLV